MDDKEAIEKTLAGTVEAFGCLVSRYQPMVYAVAVARVYDRQDAQDLSQEAFLRAYTRLPMLKNHDAFAPWLLTILRRLCVDFMRGKWRTERLQQTLHGSEQLAEMSADPRQGISALDTTRTLWSRVGQLDDISREVLSLHYGQELKVSEIAALTETKESTVKMRLHKARAVLGDRIGDLKGVWGIAPLPTFSPAIMEAISAVGPLKGGIAASSLLGGALAFPALISLFWWSTEWDVKRWHNHAPAGMLTQRKRIIIRGVLLFAAALLLAPLVAAVIAASITAAHLHGLQTVLAPYWVIYWLIVAAAFGAIFKREIDLLSPREKVKQLAGLGGAIVVLAAVSLWPAYSLGALGVFLVLQRFVVNKSNIALGAVPPGFWVAPLLTHGVVTAVTTIPIAEKQIKPWLTILNEYGLVAPPLRKDKESFTVRLRLRGSLFEKMAWGTHSSSLRVNTQGMVSCSIIPRDYVSLVQHLGLDELPGRQELATSLGDSFTRALGTYAKGGDKVAIAASLGLVQCPIDSTKTYGFLLQRYVLPLIGVVLIVIFVLRLLS
ncbi:MAG: sigma-70 family RNA polymerase sigma factor [Candidatus Hydrogenedentes bacterium]|nr:sigma-70 family RNA polymerase sigma factor [Candidatus Hydrogenedentota bacterium]